MRLSTIFYVNVYYRDRRYGGAEEGGWWYDTGTFENTPAKFTEEDEAKIYADALNEDFGDPNLSSVNGGGQQALVQTEPGESWPTEQPYYS